MKSIFYNCLQYSTGQCSNAVSVHFTPIPFLPSANTRKYEKTRLLHPMQLQIKHRRDSERWADQIWAGKGLRRKTQPQSGPDIFRTCCNLFRSSALPGPALPSHYRKKNGCGTLPSPSCCSKLFACRERALQNFLQEVRGWYKPRG